MNATVQWLFAEDRRIRRPLTPKKARKVREIKSRLQFELRRIQQELREYGYES